jgi:hypothetical protein
MLHIIILSKLIFFLSKCLNVVDFSVFAIAANGQGLLQGWNSLLVRPEPLLIKDIKVQVNKQKPNNVRPAQMKHNSDKMPNCSNVQPALQQTQCCLHVPLVVVVCLF